MPRHTSDQYNVNLIASDLFRTAMVTSSTHDIGDFTFSGRKLINSEYKFWYIDLRNQVSVTFLPKMNLFHIDIGDEELLVKSLKEIGVKLHPKA